jgi:16S rRNA (guanine527-N7)-methyltransferase
MIYQEKLMELARLVENKAKVVNITAIRDYESILEKHIKDSLEIKNSDVWNNLLKANKKLSILDLGTGGGFPGLPLAIEYPEHGFTLLDSTRKKIEAVTEFSRKLDLKNVEPVWARSDELLKDSKYKNNFDVVTSRAVAYLPKLIEMAGDFLKPGGLLVFFKNFSEEEMRDGNDKATSMGFEILNPHKYNVDNFLRAITFYKK